VTDATLAFHVDQLFYPTPGGIGTYVRRLVPELAEADPGLDIALFHARFGPGRPPEAWTRRFWTDELPQGIRTLYPGWATVGRPRLPPSVEQRRLLHAPSPSAVPPKGPRQRLVVTVHDVAFLSNPEVFPPRWRLLFRLGLRRALRTADAIVTPSRFTADELIRLTSAERSRIHVTPLAPALPVNGAEVEPVLARYKIRSPYILYNGTLEPRKNVVRLVRAYRRIVRGGAHHALVLAGALGWRPDDLLREIRGAPPGRVVLTGHVPERDLDALFRGASAFVYPSLSEGFGLPVLDAMARGIPCVVSAASSLPEVAGDAAILVDPTSTPALAEALRSVLEDEGLAARLAEAGSARAATYSWRRTAESTLAVYRSIL
jgi:glycosyltransferase involved in cell wall biosynthesis